MEIGPPSQYRTLVQKLIQPGTVGTYPTILNILKYKDKPLVFSYTSGEYKLIHLYYLTQNPVLSIIQSVFQTVPNWKNK